MNTALRHTPPTAMIRYAIGRCWLGTLLIALGERGLCAILIGDDAQALARDLQARFPRARLVHDDAGLADALTEIARFIQRPGDGLALPLAPQGTEFQQRVWQVLRQVPAGRTTTYTELARILGIPGSVRAVAGACAANPLAVVVPCHRVIRRDGGLAGYRWGLERKRALLEHEALP